MGYLSMNQMQKLRDAVTVFDVALTTTIEEFVDDAYTQGYKDGKEDGSAFYASEDDLREFQQGGRTFNPPSDKCGTPGGCGTPASNPGQDDFAQGYDAGLTEGRRAGTQEGFLDGYIAGKYVAGQ